MAYTASAEVISMEERIARKPTINQLIERHNNMRLWRKYKDLLKAKPAKTIFLTSALLGALGDAAAQFLQNRNNEEKKPFDFYRTAKFTLFSGLYSAFPQHRFFKAMEKPIGGFRRLNNFEKLVIANGVWNPLIYFPMFFGYMGFLNGDTPSEMWNRYKLEMPPSMVQCALVYVPVTIGQYMLVPKAVHIPFLSVAGLVWNIILSSTSGSAPVLNEDKSFSHYEEHVITAERAVKTISDQVLPQSVMETVKTIPETVKIAIQNMVDAIPLIPLVRLKSVVPSNGEVAVQRKESGSKIHELIAVNPEVEKSDYQEDTAVAEGTVKVAQEKVDKAAGVEEIVLGASEEFTRRGSKMGSANGILAEDVIAKVINSQREMEGSLKHTSLLASFVSHFCEPEEPMKDGMFAVSMSTEDDSISNSAVVMGESTGFKADLVKKQKEHKTLTLAKKIRAVYSFRHPIVLNQEFAFENDKCLRIDEDCEKQTIQEKHTLEEPSSPARGSVYDVEEEYFERLVHSPTDYVDPGMSPLDDIFDGAPYDLASPEDDSGNSAEVFKRLMKEWGLEKINV